jgi:hypothetical protein
MDYTSDERGREEVKIYPGDLVRIAKDLGPHMSHFTADCDAIVAYVGGGGYGLHIKGDGTSAWYEHRQLTLLERSRWDLLEQWQAEEAEADRQQSDLDWIFANGPQVLKRASGASIEALAECVDLRNLWGQWGEGYTYYMNSLAILGEAEPFLERGDKAGWLKHCEELKARIHTPTDG